MYAASHGAATGWSANRISGCSVARQQSTERQSCRADVHTSRFAVAPGAFSRLATTPASLCCCTRAAGIKPRGCRQRTMATPTSVQEHTEPNRGNGCRQSVLHVPGTAPGLFRRSPRRAGTYILGLRLRKGNRLRSVRRKPGSGIASRHSSGPSWRSNTRRPAIFAARRRLFSACQETRRRPDRIMRHTRIHPRNSP